MPEPVAQPVRRVVTRPGLPASVWEPTLARAGTLRLPRRLDGQAVLVVAAHADDETLGAAGLVQALHRRAAAVRLVVCTDGAAAFPGLAADRRRELAATRRAETHEAICRLGLTRSAALFLDVPDGAAAVHEQWLAAELAGLGRDCPWWLAPWRHDPHPDHQAVGRAAVAGAPAGVRLLGYPIWMRHSMRPRDPRVRSGRLRVLALNRRQLARKQLAIAAHASQVTVWDDTHEPVLPAHVTTVFRGRREPFFEEHQP